MSAARIIYRASYESRHFSFEGYGATEAEARAALASAFAEHARQCDVAADWLAEATRESEDSPVQIFALGRGYRDGSLCDRGAHATRLQSVSAADCTDVYGNPSGPLG